MSADPLQALLQGQSLEANLFPPGSRYHGQPSARYTTADGEDVVYLRRRFVPAPEELDETQRHTVQQGDRLDLLAAQYLGDPELFWRLCDANRAMEPQELTETVGRQLRITLPAGVPGVGGAR